MLEMGLFDLQQDGLLVREAKGEWAQMFAGDVLDGT
jgi:hypothetical protein